jgi:hypothetical protein
MALTALCLELRNRLFGTSRVGVTSQSDRPGRGKRKRFEDRAADSPSNRQPPLNLTLLLYLHFARNWSLMKEALPSHFVC